MRTDDTPPLRTRARTGTRARALAALLYLVLGITPRLAHAHGTGAGVGDPLSWIEPWLAEGSVQLGFFIEHTSQRARSDDDPAFTEEVVRSGLRAVLAMNPSEPLTLSLQVPVTRKHQTHQTPGFAPSTTQATGLGDVDLAVRYQLPRGQPRGGQLIGVTLGSTLPTGHNDAQRGGYRLDEHGQLGSGAAAPYLGLSYRFETGPWAFATTLIGRAPLANRYQYRYGSSLNLNLRASWRFAERFGLNLGTLASFAEPDLHALARQGNTGGALLSLTPALFYELVHGLALNASAQLPVLSRLNGEQLMRPSFALGVSYWIE